MKRCLLDRVETIILLTLLMLIFATGHCIFQFQQGSTNLPPLTRRLRRRSLSDVQQSLSPTASPTRKPIRVTIYDHSFEGKNSHIPPNSQNSQITKSPQQYDDAGSNDNEFNPPVNNVEMPSSSSIDGTRRLAIISVSLSTIFVALLLSVVAWKWRKDLTLSGGKDGSGEDGSQDSQNENTFDLNGKCPQHKSAKAGVSILRNGVSESPDFNSDSGRRVRFYMGNLPGSPAVIDQAVVESAERDEGGLHDPKLMTPRKFNRSSAKINVEGLSLPPGSLIADRRHLSPIHEAGETIDFENAGIAPRPVIRNDPETWVSRIMNPFLDSSSTPLFCHECCDDFGGSNQQHKTPSEESILEEHATLGATSFDSNESSKMNDASSLTPILPKLPTSSKIEEDDDNERKKSKREEREPDREVYSVLGIMGRRDAENQSEDALVLEEVSIGRKRLREATPPPPPCDYGWDGNRPTSSAKASWRTKPWATLDAKRKRTKAQSMHNINPMEDEFDLESSNSDYGTGNYGPGRVEI